MKYFSILIMVLMLIAMGCSDGEKNAPNEPVKPKKKAKSMLVNEAESKGIGPIKSIALDAIDEPMAVEGKVVFKAKCSACHKASKRFVGPAMKGVTDRRTPEWIMNMILNPEEMVKKDPTARKLMEEYLSPMANQNLTEDEARKILEYFRTLSEKS